MWGNRRCLGSNGVLMQFFSGAPSSLASGSPRPRTGANSPFERTSAKVFHHPTEPAVCTVANNSCGASL